MLHIYRNWDIPNDKYYPPEYIDCNTGEIYSWERIKEFKSSGMDIYRHRSFETFSDYMEMSSIEYSRKYYATPILIEMDNIP